MQYPGFIGGSSPSQSPLATSERTVNLYVEHVTTQGPQNKMALFPTPGRQPWVTGLGSDGRAALSVNGRSFMVLGTNVYEVFANKTVMLRGTIADDGNLAQIVSNGVGGQLGIASGGNGYCYVLATNVLTQVLTGECHQIGMLDEYFLAFNATTGKLRLSNLADGTTWDPTQFILRSTQPDNWAAMRVNAPDIWLLGDQTGDVLYDAGTSPFPLGVRTGLNVPYGVAALFSLEVTSGAMFWLGKNKDGAGLVVKAQGYAPQPISTGEVDTAIATYQRTTTIADAEALVYQDQGHTFYVLRFPTANATWVYDLMTGIWAERGTWNAPAEQYDVWAPRIHMQAFGLHLTADVSSGTIAVMDVTFGTEVDGTAIRRLRRGALLIAENARIPIGQFELSFEAGLGSATGQGVTPTVMARFSADGGKTWGTERTASLGAMGNYRVRAVFTRLGSPRLFVPEITFTDPTPLRMMDAFINNNNQQQAT